MFDVSGLMGMLTPTSYEQIRELGRQYVGNQAMAQMPGAAQAVQGLPGIGGMPNVANPVSAVVTPADLVPSQANPPPGLFPTMAGIPDPMTQPGRQIAGPLLANGNPMASGMNPASMAGAAGLAGMLMGGRDQEPQQRPMPGAGTPMMRPMGIPQMMGVGQLLRRG